MLYALAAASGVLLTLSFPKFGHPAFGWIALAPLLVAVTSGTNVEFPIPGFKPRRVRAFFLGLTTGIVYFTGTLYWITRVMVVYGGLQGWVAVLVNASLIAYLALFPAFFAAIVRRLTIVMGERALLAVPFVWVATELGRTHLLSGFPWVLLGYSQATVLPIAQFASVFGVYGVSALVASVSAAAVAAARPPARTDPAEAGPAQSRPAEAGHSVRVLVPVAALVLAIAIWGGLRASRAEWTRSGDPVRIGLVQGNVDQGQKTDVVRAAAIFHNHLQLTRQAIARGAEFVLWPESSTPFWFEEDPAAAGIVRTLARQARVPLLIGSDQVEWRTEGGRRVADKMYNSAFLVRSDGATAGVYRKMHLVPFGEYVPLGNLLFFAAPLVEAIGSGFAAGQDPTVLPVDIHGGHGISVSICYEVVYPALVREFVLGGSELLTTITNDAWFGQTSAPYQHFAQASMRAIEEGRYLVRAANTGVSGIVDPYGRVLVRTEIFEPTVVVGDARFLKVSTFYARHGDVLAYASVVLTAALLALGRRVQ